MSRRKCSSPPPGATPPDSLSDSPSDSQSFRARRAGTRVHVPRQASSAGTPAHPTSIAVRIGRRRKNEELGGSAHEIGKLGYACDSHRIVLPTPDHAYSRACALRSPTHAAVFALRPSPPDSGTHATHLMLRTQASRRTSWKTTEESSGFARGIGNRELWGRGLRSVAVTVCDTSRLKLRTEVSPARRTSPAVQLMGGRRKKEELGGSAREKCRAAYIPQEARKARPSC
ncbi:hypothetical protein B0H17DRAFT_1221750 [Mycena rosella]|uniref:Uncharacterized protein n=1 Tax=Mycena rosella TaxID=1033263 RepID=A0AAD7B0N1_MYCRO|nr:hypothetical protein B0H17DRAFT_1221750 [Mycena rosella]